MSEVKPMKRLWLGVIVLWCLLAVALIGLLIGSHLYWAWYWSVFQKGFDRGTYFTARYHQCFGKYPSRAFQLEASHYVNEPFTMPCELLEGMEQRGQKAP